MVTMSKEADIYYTISTKMSSEIKIKKSRFIATAIPITYKEQALSEIEQVRNVYKEASHHCWAYRIGNDGMEFRYSDAGEPKGSAGKPILFCINKYEFSDILVVVTRYFGGIKLGVGGLSRAYSDSSEEVLKLCEKKPVFMTTPIKIFCTYQDFDIIKKLIIKNAIRYEEIFHDSVEAVAHIPDSKLESFTLAITENTSGRAGFQIQTIKG
jgi:uncharacterized YigZ family protein